MVARWVFLCSERCSNDAATKTVGHRASVHFEVSAPFLGEGRGMVVGEEHSTKAEERGTSGGYAQIMHAQLQTATPFTYIVIVI